MKGGEEAEENVKEEEDLQRVENGKCCRKLSYQLRRSDWSLESHRQTDAETEAQEEEEEEELQKKREKGDCNKSSSNKLFVDFFPNPLLYLLGARRAVAVPFYSSADFYGP